MAKKLTLKFVCPYCPEPTNTATQGDDDANIAGSSTKSAARGRKEFTYKHNLDRHIRRLHLGLLAKLTNIKTLSISC